MPAPTFQERMYERIKESLGELLSEEEAKALVDKAIEESLFKPRVVQTHSYRTETKESLFVEMVKEAVQPLVAQAIKEWLADNSDGVEEVIRDVLGKGILNACYQALTKETRDATIQLQGNLFSALTRIGAS